MPTTTRARQHDAVVQLDLTDVSAAADGCCSPLVAQPLGASEAEVLAARLKALADPTRLRLVSLVAAHEDAKACVCDLVEPVGLSQPTVSHHLKILVDAGIFTREQRGKWAYYTVQREALTSLARLISA